MHAIPDIFEENRRLGASADRVAWGLGVLGAAGLLTSLLIAAVIEDGWSRFLYSYLVSFCFLLSVALGALFFVILQHLTRAGWSVTIRRLAEYCTTCIPLLGVLAIPILIGMHQLYHWSHADAVAGDELLQWKRPWLNPTFFVARIVFYFLVWGLLARYFFTTSVRQDESGEVKLTLRMQAVSAPAMVLFALTVTFAAFDLLMSLDPHWYSTIFGVYFFAGGVVGFFALLTLVTFTVQQSGRLRHVITVEHYHDLGKLIFAFIVFWAYIAFSQYMLIWYANIPEETTWLLERQTGQWAAVGLILLFGHFVVPFLALIARIPKRQKRALVLGAVWVLAMHWVDMYWLVMPTISPGRVPLHVLDATCLIGLGGLCTAAVMHRMRRHSLVPERDPRLREALIFENV
jgi:hypothetical protein